MDIRRTVSVHMLECCRSAAVSLPSIVMNQYEASISRAVVDAIQTFAEAARPSECCGLLSGSNGIITDLHPLRNLAEQPEIGYFAAPEDLFQAMVRIRESGHKLIGIYHSHPKTMAYPSSKDVAMAFYPDAYYFIISLEPAADLRAFRIEDARIEAVTINLIDAAQ